MSAVLDTIAARLAAGERLTLEDARAIAATPNIVAIGMLADEARRQRHGDRVTFVRVVEMGVSELVHGADGIAESLEDLSAGELRIVGDPDSVPAAAAAVRAAVALADGVPLSGFSLAHLEALAAREGMALASALGQLRDAGLDLVAEAPLDRLHDAQRSLEAAAEAGVPVARCSVHRVDDEDRLAPCARARALQGALGTLRTFAPLPRVAPTTQPTTGYVDVKQVALARLLVDNIDSIQVDWTLYGPKLAQVALTFGANDVDAVSPHDDQSRGRRRAPLEEIRRNIQAASFIPVERNGRFEIVTR